MAGVAKYKADDGSQARRSLSSTASASRRTGHSRGAAVEAPDVRGTPGERAAPLMVRRARLKMMCPPTALPTAWTGDRLPPVRRRVPPPPSSNPRAIRALPNPHQSPQPQCCQWLCPWPKASSSVACGAPRSQPSSAAAADARQLRCPQRQYNSVEQRSKLPRQAVLTDMSRETGQAVASSSAPGSLSSCTVRDNEQLSESHALLQAGPERSQELAE